MMNDRNTGSEKKGFQERDRHNKEERSRVRREKKRNPSVGLLVGKKHSTLDAFTLTRPSTMRSPSMEKMDGTSSMSGAASALIRRAASSTVSVGGIVAPREKYAS
jgi:hypothetical protein